MFLETRKTSEYIFISTEDIKKIIISDGCDDDFYTHIVIKSSLYAHTIKATFL